MKLVFATNNLHKLEEVQQLLGSTMALQSLDQLGCFRITSYNVCYTKLLRKCNKIQALPESIGMIMANLPSGYFRDLQLIKEMFIPAIEELMDCLLV